MRAVLSGGGEGASTKSAFLMEPTVCKIFKLNEHLPVDLTAYAV